MKTLSTKPSSLEYIIDVIIIGGWLSIFLLAPILYGKQFDFGLFIFYILSIIILGLLIKSTLTFKNIQYNDEWFWIESKGKKITVPLRDVHKVVCLLSFCYISFNYNGKLKLVCFNLRSSRLFGLLSFYSDVFNSNIKDFRNSILKAKKANVKDY